MSANPIRNLLFAAAMAALAATAHAKTLRVDPDPGNTPIADAVAQLEDGDKLILSAGTYDEPLALDGLAKVRVIGKGEVVLDAVSQTASISVTDCEKVRLQGLIVRDAPMHGVMLMNSTKVALKRVGVENPTEQGIVVVGTDKAAIQRCAVSDGTDGIYVTGASSARVTRNTLTGQSGRGVFVLDVTLPGTTISKNDIDGATNAGIELNGTGNRADRNTLTNCGNGIRTRSTAGDRTMTDSSITRNTITDPVVGLLVFATGGLEISKNRIEGATVAVMQIASTAADLVVSKNKSDSGTFGIDDEGANSTVTKNKLTGNTNSAIRARGSGGDYSRNVLKDSDGIGFDVWTGGHTFTKNKASGNAGGDLVSTRVAEGDNTYVDNAFGTTEF